MNKPSLGRIVLTPVDPAINNGADVAPAVITRVWNDTTINVRVLLDGHAIDWKTSVTLYDEPPTGDPKVTHYAFWPPRV